MKKINPTWITPNEICKKSSISREKLILWLKSNECPFGYGYDGPDGFLSFVLRKDFDKWYETNIDKFTGKVCTTWIAPYEVGRKLNMSVKKVELWLNEKRCPFGLGLVYNNIFLDFIFRADFENWYKKNIEKI